MCTLIANSRVLLSLIFLFFLSSCSSLTQTKGLKRLGTFEIEQNLFVSYPGAGVESFESGYSFRLGLLKGLSIGTGFNFNVIPFAGIGDIFLPLEIRVSPKINERISLDFHYKLQLQIIHNWRPYHLLEVGGIYTPSPEDGSAYYLGFKGVFDYYKNSGGMSVGPSIAFEKFIIPEKNWLSVVAQVDFLIPAFTEENKKNYNFRFLWTTQESLNLYLGISLGINFYLDFLKPLSEQF